MSRSDRPPRLVTADAIPDSWRGAVLAIGNFDGMHRGHQAVLKAAKAEAEHLGAPCVMLTFEPHPRAFFSGRPLFRLTPASMKASLAAGLGFDGTLVLTFDRALADESPEHFVRGMLLDRLAIRAAVTGHDFHFGKARRGSPHFLVQEGIRHGFAVTVVAALLEDGEAVSSTRIRGALKQGDIATANNLLGWHFAVAGDVVHGDARGRELGYPTANIVLDPASELSHGIYAVRYLGSDGQLRDGVASYGRRPTFGGGKPVLETFLFDYSGDLYGETPLVSFYGFIRPEQKFDSVAALVARMDEDSILARAMLDRTPPADLDRLFHQAWLRRNEAHQ